MTRSGPSEPPDVFAGQSPTLRRAKSHARKRRRIEELAARTITHPATYVVVWAAAESETALQEAGLSPFDEAAWKKANPATGSLAWLFPGADGSYDAVWRFWLPEDQLPKPGFRV